MKRLIALTILFLSTLAAQAQVEKNELPVTLSRHENKETYYEKVFSAENVLKAELYNRVKQWVTSNASTSDNNIVFDDKDNNYINTSNGIVLEKVPGVTVNYKISIAFKDGKVKLACSSFKYINVSQGVIYQHELGTITFGSANKRIYRSFDDSFGKFLSSFEAAINAPAKADSNW